MSLVNEGVYHVFTKSIAGFRIFNNLRDYMRIEGLILYYQNSINIRFSYRDRFTRQKSSLVGGIESTNPEEKIVNIIAYCIMPTHLHFILKQLKEHGISAFMGKILNSYSKYFNTKYKRKGPLWEGRFKRVLVESDEQLLHLTRYVHLNPVTAGFINNPEDWSASSYREYVFRKFQKEKICQYQDLLAIKPTRYRQFVEGRISYQRQLAKIKDFLFD
ncbi:MAG: transposase [Candidatus Omnitrophica bacterium]|nr:transposase [Candidatus Omnitrophota bacterium]